MMKTSGEVLVFRTESHRVSVQQLHKGSVLRSQVAAAGARELEAKILFRQSQLEYIKQMTK